MARDSILLKKIGHTLYGDDWISPLARDLGINRINLQRWTNGHTPLTDQHEVWGKIVKVLKIRIEKNLEMNQEIKLLLKELAR